MYWTYMGFHAIARAKGQAKQWLESPNFARHQLGRRVLRTLEAYSAQKGKPRPYPRSIICIRA